MRTRFAMEFAEMQLQMPPRCSPSCEIYCANENRNKLVDELVGSARRRHTWRPSASSRPKPGTRSAPPEWDGNPCTPISGDPILAVSNAEEVGAVRSARDRAIQALLNFPKIEDVDGDTILQWIHEGRE
jgi:hypothetical protein